MLPPRGAGHVTILTDGRGISAMVVSVTGEHKFSFNIKKKFMLRFLISSRGQDQYSNIGVIEFYLSVIFLNILLVKLASLI